MLWEQTDPSSLKAPVFTAGGGNGFQIELSELMFCWNSENGSYLFSFIQLCFDLTTIAQLPLLNAAWCQCLPWWLGAMGWLSPSFLSAQMHSAYLWALPYRPFTVCLAVELSWRGKKDIRSFSGPGECEISPTINWIFSGQTLDLMPMSALRMFGRQSRGRDWVTVMQRSCSHWIGRIMMEPMTNNYLWSHAQEQTFCGQIIIARAGCPQFDLNVWHSQPQIILNNNDSCVRCIVTAHCCSSCHDSTIYQTISLHCFLFICWILFSGCLVQGSSGLIHFHTPINQLSHVPLCALMFRPAHTAACVCSDVQPCHECVNWCAALCALMFNCLNWCATVCTDVPSCFAWTSVFFAVVCTPTCVNEIICLMLSIIDWH